MFFRKKIFKSAEQKAAEEQPKTKKVQYVPMDIAELRAALNADIGALVPLEPVNYYASKDKFLQCTFHYNEDYSQVYFVVELYEYDRPVASTAYYKADYELMKRALRRFGQQI